MNDEIERKILSGLAINFLETQAQRHEVYLYDNDVLADDIYALPVNRCIKITFEYADVPREEG